MPSTVKGRFAPSPTGRMHLGNVFSALLSWLSVRKQGGSWLLRIEDIDPQRSRKEYADLIMDDLQWLGLLWDEGPYYQSQRSGIYREQLDRLIAMGLVYPCHCTRADILATQAPHESDGRVVYKGTCRPAAPVPFDVDAHDAALRMMVPPNVCDSQPLVAFTDGHYGSQAIDLARHCGDFIVRRKDGAWAYQLAVVVDDALMGITEVVRGRDLLLSSPQQIYLARLLGYEAPRYIHFPLLCNEHGQRLSKRDASLDMAVLRQSTTPQELIGRLAYIAGLAATPAPTTPEALIHTFDWSKVPVNDLTVYSKEVP